MNDFKIALVNPHDNTVPTEYFAPCENLALAYLTSYLRQEGFNAHIIDGDAEKLDNHEVVKLILNLDVKLVGITCLSRTIDDALDIATIVKRNNPSIHVCLGGQHVTYVAEDILKENISVNSIVRGEGEETFAEIAKRISQGKTLANVDGVYYRNESMQIIKNRDRKVIRNIDELPFPARDVLEKLIERGHNPVLSVLSSRGCYGTCNFCNASTFSRLGGGVSWRGRSAKNVVDELELLCKKYEAGSLHRLIHFYDDNFVGPGRVGRQRVREIAEEILKRELDIIFYIFCRADSFVLDPELLSFLKKAGLITAFVGIESSRESELKLFSKGTTPEQNIETIRLMQQNNITMPASGFIMFHPYSTYEDLRSNAIFLHGIGQASYWNLSVKLIVYEGTKIVNRLKNDGLLRRKIAHGGIYEYDFITPKIGELASAMDFSTHHIMLKADAVVRYIQFTKSYILQKMPNIDIGQINFEVIDKKINKIFDLSYNFFMAAVDLSEKGWNPKLFNRLKETFLLKINEHIEDLDAVFYTCLESISNKMEISEREEQFLGI